LFVGGTTLANTRRMNVRLAAFGFVFTSLAGTLAAHGGQYRGPGEVVPPTSGTGTSATGNKS